MEKGHPMEASGLSRRSRIKPFLATTVTLLLVAVAMCAVVAVFSANTAPGQSIAAALPGQETIEARSLVDKPHPAEDKTFEADDSPDSEIPRIRTARYLKIEENDTEDSSNEAVDSSSHTNHLSNISPSCFSDISNKTVPAAHIKGKGLKFMPSSRESSTNGYQQRWECTELQSGGIHKPPVHAFVDGGMCFNQTDNTLGVPKCGYYMVTSQVMFNIYTPLSDSRTVYHQMSFKRNCPGSYSTQSVMVTGKSTVGPFNSDNYHAGVVTTFTSDIIKLCAGGKVSLFIPDGENGVPCCPSGNSHGTFITAVLVRESTCHWPPDTKIRYLDSNNS